ncbi:DUF1345 domain-containing protein [Mucilaginibacter paludis]|uniref:DUF1345 domain-containing protein n=1 Tax=Mucilaginibacter paludis DSM 18603 TaxID=714943 RepID=H1Y0Q8_9SPHI|nr:DUF1345 domain-containing protein [Mucilaginibacter paludis]EHQ28798.1 protein of unknown function DUF1345 [Mucilaginibacter paludis DSM 18603]
MTQKEPKIDSLIRFDTQYRLLIALGVTAIVFFVIQGHVSVPALIILSWLTCASVIILMDWLIILSSNPREMRKIARMKDSSRFSILGFVIAASCVSLFSVLFLLKSSKGEQHGSVNHHIMLAIGSVVISWWMLHTVFTMSYAHLYYTSTPDPDDDQNEVIGGLQFPDEKTPDYLDFVYFAFVIGMTFQVSDVEVSSRSIRRLVLVHGLISFAFNTAIVALSINVVSGIA